MVHPSKSILIVDPDEGRAALLSASISGALLGQVAIVEPNNVLATSSQSLPELIVLNLDLPDINGFSLLQELRRAVGGPDVLPIIVIADQRDRERALALGATEFLTEPLDPIEVATRAKTVAQAAELRKQLEEQGRDFESKLRERTTKLWEAVKQLEESEQKVRLSQEETVTKLATAAEFRDDETTHHVRRMSSYCALIAERSGAPRDRVDLIRMASGMHDVGKIGIPYLILLKKGKLTPEERSFMEQHTTIGHKILGDSHSDLLQLGATIALSHHERIDGKGYPNGIKGDEIPLEARIAAIADVFDALTTDRVYRRAFELTTALQMMREGRGSQFDAKLLDVFFASISDVLNIKEAHHDQGQSFMQEHVHQRAGNLEAGSGS
jgi:putative two-component system response regulator